MSPDQPATSSEVGICQEVPALASDPLLADFEQDTVFLRPVPERSGSWYLVNDGSPEGRQTPESYRAERSGYGGSSYALHARFDGFSNWGALLGFSLRYTPAPGTHCPFNAEAFAGLAFMARGVGRLRVNVAIAETTPVEQDGQCLQGCRDNPGSFVFLSETWTEHRVLWSQLAQQGWGAAVRTSLRQVLAINFSASREDQPLEVWLDDVRFLPLTAETHTPPKAP